MKADNIFCAGIQCSIKNTCLRYTEGVTLMVQDGTTAKYIRKCTNQRLYKQDTTKVNESCLMK